MQFEQGDSLSSSSQGRFVTVTGAGMDEDASGPVRKWDFCWNLRKAFFSLDLKLGRSRYWIDCIYIGTVVEERLCLSLIMVLTFTLLPHPLPWEEYTSSEQWEVIIWSTFALHYQQVSQPISVYLIQRGYKRPSVCVCGERGREIYIHIGTHIYIYSERNKSDNSNSIPVESEGICQEKPCHNVNVSLLTKWWETRRTGWSPLYRFSQWWCLWVKLSWYQVSHRTRGVGIQFFLRESSVPCKGRGALLLPEQVWCSPCWETRANFLP